MGSSSQEAIMTNFLMGINSEFPFGSLRADVMAILKEAWGNGKNGNRKCAEQVVSIEERRKLEVVVIQKNPSRYTKPGKLLFEALVVRVGEAVLNMVGGYRVDDKVVVQDDDGVGAIPVPVDAMGHVYPYEDVLYRF